MVALAVSSPVTHLHEPPPEQSPMPIPLLPGQLTGEQLRRAFRFLMFDYQATIVGTSHLPNDERFELVRQRLADYSDALADALGDAADDAAILVRGQRQQRGEVGR